MRFCHALVLPSCPGRQGHHLSFKQSSAGEVYFLKSSVNLLLFKLHPLYLLLFNFFLLLLFSGFCHLFEPRTHVHFLSEWDILCLNWGCFVIIFILWKTSKCLVKYLNAKLLAHSFLWGFSRINELLNERCVTSWHRSASLSLIFSSISFLRALSSSIFLWISSSVSSLIFSNLDFRDLAWMVPVRFSFVSSSYSVLTTSVLSLISS